jgi:3-isopropylmalate/(R)-2-methylmalate dehydratase small subunit
MVVNAWCTGVHEGLAAPLPAANIDTDVVIPQLFLKSLSRQGMGRGLFHGLRHDAQGRPHGRFVLDQPRYREASILVAGPNFGCGSAREHAPWALVDHGIRCIVAESFADIFFGNALINGLLPVVLPAAAMVDLFVYVEGAASPWLRIDVRRGLLLAPGAGEWSFALDAARCERLVRGEDAIAALQTMETQVRDFERRHWAAHPWLKGISA